MIVKDSGHFRIAGRTVYDGSIELVWPPDTPQKLIDIAGDGFWHHLHIVCEAGKGKEWYLDGVKHETIAS